jgi:threonine 3-dehydrogenase
MLALKKLYDKPGLWGTDDAPIPVIGRRDVLVAVTHTGICGTDRHIYEWDAWSRSRVRVGVTTGHEFVGRVAQVGEAVARVRIGQRVSAEGHVGCGCCRPCRTGNGHICEDVQILGIDRDGCFAQYVAVPEANIWPIDERIPDPIAAIFDPLGNAMHTVMAAGVSGKSVLITGVGTIGLMAVTIARAAGAARIFVSDVDRRRLDLARRLGAQETFQAGEESWPVELRRATAGRGADVLLEMSGHPQAIEHGFSALARGGTAALLGLPSDRVSLDLANDIIFKGATVLGINGRRMFETWYQVEEFVLSGRLDLAPIITHQLPIDDFEKGFHLMQSGEAIKVVLTVPHTSPTRQRGTQESISACPTPDSTTAAVNCSLH